MATDLFSSYAEQAIPKTVQRRAAKQAQRNEDRIKAVQDEDRILAKMARAQEKAWRARVIDYSENPMALQSILDQFKRFGPDDGEAMVETVRQAATMFAGRETRFLLTRVVAEACARINRKLDREPLDDPLPPETSVFLDCRELLR